MIDLHGHAALVTGSTQGVGRAIAQAMARAGADVLVHGLAGGDGAEATVAACRAAGVRSEFVAHDLSGPTGRCVQDLFDAAIAALPGIDILVNNAGTYEDVAFLDMDVARFEHTLRLNVAAPFFLTQRFARHWVRRGIDGRVVLIGSINGRLAEPCHSGYDTSKGAVEMMVRTLCVELAPFGIRVNGLAPGLVVTPLTAAVERDPALGRWMALHTPNGQVPGADVCGEAAVFLVSDAARHVHGHMLAVDGGMSAWQQPAPPSA